MIWIILIIMGILILLLAGCKSKPDPHSYKWQQVNITTERWARYIEGMGYINSDTKVALEMRRKDEDGKPFYIWTAEEKDYWDLPDEVWESGRADCDGLARLTSDGLGRFAKYPDVHWMEYYGFYRKYYYENGEWYYKVVAGGHAITAYKKGEQLKAFSNTSWWDENFVDYVEIGEQTFPEGLYWVICRHWDNGKMQWQKKAKDDEILRGTNVFHRYLVKMKSIKNLRKAEIEEMKKCLRKAKLTE